MYNLTPNLKSIVTTKMSTEIWVEIFNFIIKESKIIWLIRLRKAPKMKYDWIWSRIWNKAKKGGQPRLGEEGESGGQWWATETTALWTIWLGSVAEMKPTNVNAEALMQQFKIMNCREFLLRRRGNEPDLIFVRIQVQSLHSLGGLRCRCYHEL